ncbi:MAG: IS66 family insertion sequence element accessory protein TnpB [Saprospiraceae bacterium]
MISLSSTQRYYLWRGVADMRKGFDGLSGLVRNEMGQDPLDGSVYIFINRRATHIKLLVWDRSGFVLYYKRLERGRFHFPKEAAGGGYKISWQALVLMLEGIEVANVKQKKRYSFPQKQAG